MAIRLLVNENAKKGFAKISKRDLSYEGNLSENRRKNSRRTNSTRCQKISHD